ncbi:MAG: lipase [Rhodospirillales bacterium]|nr:lipase [Rhodospirillales bacterium]
MTELRICFVGDSLVNGTNDPDFQGWPGRLAQAEVANGHDLSVYNLGIRGDTSVMIATRWQAECEARLPAIQPCALVFSFGVNDIALENGSRRVSFPSSLQTAREMIGAASSWLPTLWVGPPPVEREQTTFHPAAGISYEFARKEIEHLSDAYGALAAELDVPYYDLYGALKDDAEWRRAFDGSDAVHPTQTGYHLISRHIGNWPAWRHWLDA